VLAEINMELEIYDTTLREGEQAAGASFSIEERIKVCEKLDEIGVDFIELGWPFSSQDIFNSFRECISKVKKSKIAAFGSTSIKKDVENDENLKSIIACGAKYACIVGKSDLEHVEKQLRITPQANLRCIADSIRFLKHNGIEVFYDAEHYFDSFKKDKEYAIQTILSAFDAGVERVILCDTNGGILPDEAEKIIKETYEHLDKKEQKKLGVHFHNDCGLALANTLACLKYIKQVQGTINGIGERVGNLNLSEFLPVYIKKMNNKLDVNLKKLKEVNEDVFRMAGIIIPEMRAFVGDTAFAHKGGIHTDAAAKGVSYEHANPKDFGNKTIILLNTLGGRSCVASVAKEFGYKIDKQNPETKEKIKELFSELGMLEREGYRIGAINAERYLLIEKYFGNLEEFFNMEQWEIKSSFSDGKETSRFHVFAKINGDLNEEVLTVEGGPVDVAYKAMIKLLNKKYPEVNNLKLVDFHVSIAKSRKEESSVRTSIKFWDGEEFETVGVDENILNSAIEALIKGFRYYLNRRKNV
jgi:2-isopropylmalate synthase